MHAVPLFLRIILLGLVSVSGIANALAQILETRPAEESAYGSRLVGQGWVDFRVYAPHASHVDLLLYAEENATTPVHRLPMHKADTDWSLGVRGVNIGLGTWYMYRAAGPDDTLPHRPYGLFFNPNYPVNDPYAGLTGELRYSTFFTDIPLADAAELRYAGGGKSRVVDHSLDQHPGHVVIEPQDLIVYELHVQDYTARIHDLSPQLRGTYLGLAQSGLTTAGGLAAGIDHLAELGINAVELMPVMEYDEDTGNAEGRLNHWGYMTTNFFAPESRYASAPGQQVVELKQLVRAFHDKGIAVFMDVVYNHTGEGGPWLHQGELAIKCYNLMCLSNTDVYRATDDRRFYFNRTGGGNDVDFTGGERYTKRLVRDSLAHWHTNYGIDGFRFDLARILADGSDDAADWVDNDTRFSNAHLHAEPWDLGGVWWDFMDNYGWHAVNNRWAKWLGKYRDGIRQFSQSSLRDRRLFKQFIEGQGSAGDNAGTRASSRPWRSVNFLSIHDGYTLRDCTFFNDHGGSHNCWDSGNDEDLRRMRSKLMLGVLLTSQGVPLLLQGDEFGRTKSGAATQAEAHNTYNYESATGDSAIDHVNWIDWRLKDSDTSHSPNAPAYGGELFRWTRDLISLRKQWTHFRRTGFAEYVHDRPDDAIDSRNNARFTYVWEGPSGGEPTQLGVIWWGQTGEPDLMVIYNEHWNAFTIDNLSDWSRGDWRILARSWATDEDDFCQLDEWQTACTAATPSVQVPGRSMAILISDND